MASTANLSANLQETEQLLKEEKFYQVYEKAKKALKYGRDKERYLLILGKAAYGMRKWEQSVQRFEQLCEASPDNVAAKEGLDAAKARLTESRTGNFDFVKLYEAAKRGVEDIDVADYVGPIKVVDIPGKGKGIVASQDVKKGTLLIVSKAFAVVDNDYAADTALPRAILGKLTPETARDVSALYDGKDRSTAQPEPPGNPSLERLIAVCKFNAFTTEGFTDLPAHRDFEHKPLRGLWILPSYFNHSCLRNAHRTYYGDVMTVFAIADAKNGDEITINYVDPMDSYTVRASRLKLGHGFVCDCRLCELDRTDPLYQKREELVQVGLDLQAVAAEEPGLVIALLERQLSKIRATYTTRQELMMQLYSPLKSLGNLHQALGNYTPATKYFIEALECLPESSVTLHGVRTYAQIADCYDRKTHHDVGAQVSSNGRRAAPHSQWRQ